MPQQIDSFISHIKWPHTKLNLFSISQAAARMVIMIYKHFFNLLIMEIRSNFPPNKSRTPPITPENKRGGPNWSNLESSRSPKNIEPLSLRIRCPDIQLNKTLPMGGGLGGGSSNAATTLIALNEIWSLNF